MLGTRFYHKRFAEQRLLAITSANLSIITNLSTILQTIIVSQRSDKTSWRRVSVRICIYKNFLDIYNNEARSIIWYTIEILHHSYNPTTINKSAALVQQNRFQEGNIMVIFYTEVWLYLNIYTYVEVQIYTFPLCSRNS